MTDLEKIELAIRQTAEHLRKIPVSQDVILAFETLASAISEGQRLRERARLLQPIS